VFKCIIVIVITIHLYPLQLNFNRCWRVIKRRCAGTERLNTITGIYYYFNEKYYINIVMCVRINNNNFITVHFVVAHRRRRTVTVAGVLGRRGAGSQQLTAAADRVHTVTSIIICTTILSFCRVVADEARVDFPHDSRFAGVVQNILFFLRIVQQ